MKTTHGVSVNFIVSPDVSTWFSSGMKQEEKSYDRYTV